MRFLPLAIVAVSLVGLGCHSAPPTNTSPSAQAKDATEVLNETYLWSATHATTEPARACENFKALSLNQNFLAHDLATLRALQVCDDQDLTQFDRHTLPPWLQDEAVNVLLKLNTQPKKKGATKNLALELELAQDKAKQRLSQTEKIKWLNLALTDADELKRTDLSEAIKTKLYTLAPRLNPDPQPRQFLAVANDLRLARQFNRAGEFYEKILARAAAPLENKISALRGLRQNAKNSRRREDHIKASRRYVDFLKTAAKADPKNKRLVLLSYEAQVYHARALWTEGQLPAAQAVLAQLERNSVGPLSRAELYWLKARMAEEEQNYEVASQQLNLALNEPLTDDDLHDKITWYAAWNARHQGDLVHAAQTLTQLDLQTKTDFTRQRALYWLGRTQLELSRQEDAEKTFRRLIEIDPLGFYGLMAHRQLKTPITLPKKAALLSEPSEALPYDRKLVAVLAELQERDILAAYLDLTVATYAANAQNETGTKPTTVWVSILKDYARAGFYMKLYEALGRLDAGAREEILEQNVDLVFPRPYAKEIQAAAQTFGVPSELIYSIIRQESAFDPLARSGADAFGMMQLLPEVAENLSSRYKIEYHEMEDLFRPAINVKFGAAHLKELFERQKGQFILAVASYNASENVVRSWLKTHWHKDPVEFIEDIPYDETRSYVRLVMRNFVFYKLLTTRAAQIDFPEWLLELKPDAASASH